jgi:hypothetical protein
MVATPWSIQKDRKEDLDTLPYIPMYGELRKGIRAVSRPTYPVVRVLRRASNSVIFTSPSGQRRLEFSCESFLSKAFWSYMRGEDSDSTSDCDWTRLILA